jgi:hypothetical protein
MLLVGCADPAFGDVVDNSKSVVAASMMKQSTILSKA